MFENQKHVNKRQFGRSGEGLAEGYLQSRGYHILDRNVQMRQGEIDLVALDGKVVCFVEVKTRRSNVFGSGLEAVDRRKQRKLSILAALYLQKRYPAGAAARFDVVEVGFSDQGEACLTLIKNAFDSLV